MTRHIPEGNSLSGLAAAIAPLRAIAARDAGLDIYPGADIDRRLSTMPPRLPSPRPPYLALAVALALLAAAAFGAGWFASKAVANAAATVLQAEAGE